VTVWVWIDAVTFLKATGCSSGLFSLLLSYGEGVSGIDCVLNRRVSKVFVLFGVRLTPALTHFILSGIFNIILAW